MRTDHAGAATCVDLVKTYRTATGEVRALRGLTAAFPAGAMSVVAGPSGSGKSSLLRILAGIDRPTSGTVSVGGVRIDTAGAGGLRRVRQRVVGTVLQRPSDNFFPQLTVEDHLRLAIRSGRGRGASVDAADLVDLLGLSDRLGHRPDELSGGEQQRAAFAQILLSGVAIVVADEPTAELDRDSASHMLDAIDALVSRGVTFIVSSHDADVVDRSSIVLRLDHGLAEGSPPTHGTRGTGGTAATPWRGPGSVGRTRATAPVGRDARISDEHRRPAIEVRDVTKTFHRGGEAVHAVRDATVVVGEGELVGLVGRSGSGKTTLLNLMSGWERADVGDIVLADGRAVDRSAPWAEVAVLPQRLGLIEEFTVRENVEYPARLAGVLGSTEELADELIHDLGLSALQHRYPQETSVGEQQRAALARALILTPGLLLADEPTGHQDGAHARDMLEAIRQAVARGTACVAATHSDELIRYLDRVVTMADGRLVTDAATMRA